MRGFIIVSVMLMGAMFCCGASFFSQQTGLLLLSFLAMFPLIWAHGFVSGKSIEIQSPVRPKGTTATNTHAPAVSSTVQQAMMRNRPVRRLSPDEQL